MKQRYQQWLKWIKGKGPAVALVWRRLWITMFLPLAIVLIVIMTLMETVWSDGLQWLFHNMERDLRRVFEAYFSNFIRIKREVDNDRDT